MFQLLGNPFKKVATIDTPQSQTQKMTIQVEESQIAHDALLLLY